MNLTFHPFLNRRLFWIEKHFDETNKKKLIDLHGLGEGGYMEFGKIIIIRKSV